MTSPEQPSYSMVRKRRVLPDRPDGRLIDLLEIDKAHIRAKVKHSFRVIKQQFGFQKTVSAAWPRTTAKSMFWQRL
jgi:hypothetical protein